MRLNNQQRANAVQGFCDTVYSREMNRGLLPTTYFFAGGRARCPLSKERAYSAFADFRFSWIGVAMLHTYSASLV